MAGVRAKPGQRDVRHQDEGWPCTRSPGLFQLDGGTPTTRGMWFTYVLGTDTATGAVKNAGTYGVNVTQ
jgi:hypothetical protein